MPARLREELRQLGRVERVFIVALVLELVLRMAAPQADLTALFAFIVYGLGVVVSIRLAHAIIRKVIWRLRNRLIVTYLFIAVVPIVLIVGLFGLSTYWVTGQIAGYLINSELQRRTAGLQRPARILARNPSPAEAHRWLRVLAGPFPQITVVIRGGEGNYLSPQEEPPSPEWKSANGIIRRAGMFYAWAHEVGDGVDVTFLAPLTHEFMTSLAPGLGTVDLTTGVTGRVRGTEPGITDRSDRVPPPALPIDISVAGVYPLASSVWNRPEAVENPVLFLRTRTSAVLRQVFGHDVIRGNLEWGEVIWGAFVGISAMFLVVELASLVVGVSLTRTITTAVHQLYEGTQRVKEGDFSHRIPERGRDQLGELAQSFNTMTANLERLIVVAKEKERLQSELEIAREVQSQLFPKSIPDLKTLEMAGICSPARMVSGDYYDFMRLPDSSLAFAIGDVAGKGISAALLMAAIQSTMRTQLNTAAVPMAAAAGNGGRKTPISTARLVSLLNRQLYANTSPEKYATFYFALYDDESKILTYTNAGHVPPVLIRHGEPTLLKVTGTVVGAFPFAQYDEERLELLPGDLLVTYTDGIVEPENEYGEMFGEERLKEVLCKWAEAACDEVIGRTMESVNQWTGAGELQDDMTMLVARRI